MKKVSQRVALLAVQPARSYWTTARSGAAGGRDRAGAVASPSRRKYGSSLGPLAAGGQRRFLSEERKEEKKEPKAGVSVFATFIKSIRDQMGARAETDEELAAAQERLEKARLESIEKAEAAMKRAQEAAEEASALPSPMARYIFVKPIVLLCLLSARHALLLVGT